MSINLGEVFTTFIYKYNKENVLSYVGIMFVLFLFSLVFVKDSILSFFLLLTMFIIASVFYIGYFVVASNNEANNEVDNKENIFPSINQIGTIVKESIKYSFGTSLLAFVLYFLPTTLFIISVYFFAKTDNTLNSIILMILTVLLFIVSIFLIAYFLFWPIQIIYLKSLKFTDFFAFNKIKAFRKEKGSQFLKFILFSIIVYIAINALPTSLCIIMDTAGEIAKIKYIHLCSQIMNYFMVMILYTLLMPNLIGQIARYDVSKDPDIYDDEYEEDV